MNTTIPMIAGALSNILFATSMLPMLKAFRSKDLRSYSPGMLLLTNTANLVHSAYVLHPAIRPNLGAAHHPAWD